MDFVNGHFLVGADELAAELGNPALRIFDVTGMLTGEFVNLAKSRSYDEAHIPGAAFLDIAGRDQAFATPDAPLPWTWPSADNAARTLGEIGVGESSRVVLYAATPRPGIDKGMMWATRAWWLMRSFGVNCAVLDGGLEHWIAKGHPVSAEAHTYPPSQFRLAQDERSMVANKADVLAALGRANTCVVDALSERSFAGEDKARYGPRAGHIDGAVNVPMDHLLDANGCFLGAEELRNVLAAQGVLDAEEVITYCGGGIAATTDAFALALLGHEKVAVYDASLFEWAADAEAPMVART